MASEPLAIVERYRATFISRRCHEFTQRQQLSPEVGHAIGARRAVLDGEIVCLRPDGLSDFYSLLFRREWPYFYAFDLLELEGEDLRQRPLLERKRRLARIIPYHCETRLRAMGHVPGRGQDLFRLVCDHDAEGMVAKWSCGLYYTDGRTTSWLKIKNPTYSQAVGRHEVFDRRHSGLREGAPARRLDPTAIASLRAPARFGSGGRGPRAAAPAI